ncbi:MAG: hypothetical protein KGZ97_09230 [Bacteroidetes bacterium]|nr:hypothetical protein [Bacteroidota bacterium]
MENINKFSIHRIGYLVLRHLKMNMQPWLIGIAATAGALLTLNIMGVITSFGSFNLETFVRFGYFIMFVGGYIFTSRIFNELQSPAKSHFYLSLPARPEEKLISAWLISSVFFLIVSYVLISLISLLISGVLLLFFDGTLKVFNPLSIDALYIAAVFIITNSVFFLGSIYFKKNNFLKTILTVFVTFVTIFTFTLILILIIIKPFQYAHHSVGFQIDFAEVEYINSIISYLFWYAMAPFILVVSYFRLKERQV